MVTVVSNGSIRRRIDSPTSPAPTTSTRLPASSPVNFWSHSCRSCSRTNSGKFRSEASTAVSTHSEVDPPCTPRASQSVTPAGTSPMNESAPAVVSCTTSSFGSAANCASSPSRPRYCGTQKPASAASAGGGSVGRQITTVTPSGAGPSSLRPCSAGRMATRDGTGRA